MKSSNKALSRFFILFLSCGVSFSLWGSPMAKEGIDEDSLIAQNSEGGTLSVKEKVKKGKRLFSEGKFEEAYEVFKDALFDDPGSPELNHWLGQAAQKVGKYDEAVFAYERALATDPKQHVSRLEKGRAHVALGQKELAREEFQRVLEQEVPPQVRSNIELYIAQLGSARKATYSGAVMLSHTWDSNATLGTGPVPLQDTLLITEATQRSDRVSSIALILNSQYPLHTDGVTWANNIVFYNADNTTISDNDLRLVQGGTSLNYSFRSHMVSAGVNWTVLWLREHLYQSNPAAVLRYNYLFSQRLNFTAAHTYTARHHFDGIGTPRETSFGMQQVSRAGFTFIQDPKKIWSFEVSHKYDKTPRDGLGPQAYNRVELILRHTRVLNEAFTLNFAGTHRSDRYRGSHPLLPGDDAKRYDRALIGSVALNYKMRPDILIDLSTTYTDNYSNVLNFDYIAQQATISLTTLF